MSQPSFIYSITTTLYFIENGPVHNLQIQKLVKHYNNMWCVTDYFLIWSALSGFGRSIIPSTCCSNFNSNLITVTIPCLYLHFISSLLAIHFLFSSNPPLAFLLISSSIFSLSITQLFIIQPFYYSALYYSAFSLFSSITQRHFY